jgi:tetratricopeptide (TPR) repeat protein
MGPGLAWGDFDDDGDDDLFLVSAGGALDRSEEELEPCALYENAGPGKFVKVEDFPVLRVRGMGAAWCDYDGDGYPDLVVAGYDTLRLLRNEGGSGRFTRDARLPEVKRYWSGVAWGDYNRDRRPDLYVCAYVQYAVHEEDRNKISDQIGTAVPYTLNPSAFPGGLNALFRQNADGSFTDVADELEVRNPEGRSLGALWHDFDQDGWLDLYVANDVSDNVFYRNVGGHFDEISHAAWVADYRSAMGLAAGDFDRDGDDDLFVSHWVAQENALYENLWADFALGRRPTAAGNGSATAPLRFGDIADQKGLGQIALPFVGWGSEFVDLDQDGWQDLLCVNGSTLEETRPPPKALQGQATFLFWNRQGEGFHDLGALHAGLSEKHVSRGLGCADFDGDGDVDFAIADLYEGVRLFRNDMASGHWLRLRLRSKNPAGAPTGRGEGSTVIAWVEDVPLRRSVTGVSYLSQHSAVLHWGLGQATRIQKLEVRWHCGETNVWENLEADRAYELVEGESSLRPMTRPAPAVASAPTAAPGPVLAQADRERLLNFWAIQRAAMDAVKLESNNVKAIPLFRQAIELNPAHEDARYYLALSLAAEDVVAEALTTLADLQRLNPQSHRAWQQWGALQARTARTDAELAAAERALSRAHELNPEETGALLILGEVALMRGDLNRADECLNAACRTNPKAAGGFFLRGYTAWKRGDSAQAAEFLGATRKALGPDWQPKGATSEGDVRRKQHTETSPLSRFWETWDGGLDPDKAYGALGGFLKNR